MDDMSAYFIHPATILVHERPNRESMRNLQRKMYENAVSAPCQLGGGMRGRLGVTMSDVECASKFGTNFIPCAHLGPLLNYPKLPSKCYPESNCSRKRPARKKNQTAQQAEKSNTSFVQFNCLAF